MNTMLNPATWMIWSQPTGACVLLFFLWNQSHNSPVVWRRWTAGGAAPQHTAASWWAQCAGWQGPWIRRIRPCRKTGLRSVQLQHQPPQKRSSKAHALENEDCSARPKKSSGPEGVDVCRVHCKGFNWAAVVPQTELTGRSEPETQSTVQYLHCEVTLASALLVEVRWEVRCWHHEQKIKNDTRHQSLWRLKLSVLLFTAEISCTLAKWDFSAMAWPNSQFLILLFMARRFTICQCGSKELAKRHRSVDFARQIETQMNSD